MLIRFFTFPGTVLLEGHHQHMLIQPGIVHQVPTTVGWAEAVWIQSLSHLKLNKIIKWTVLVINSWV